MFELTEGRRFAVMLYDMAFISREEERVMFISFARVRYLFRENECYVTLVEYSLASNV